MNVQVRDLLTGVCSVAYFSDPPSGAECYVQLDGKTYALSIQNYMSTYTTPTPTTAPLYLGSIESALNRMASSLERVASHAELSQSPMERELDYWKIRCSAYEVELRTALDKLAKLV